MICPKDFKPCMDDLCYHGTCILLPGVPTLFECSGCGVLISDDDKSDCTCDPDEDDIDGVSP